MIPVPRTPRNCGTQDLRRWSAGMAQCNSAAEHAYRTLVAGWQATPPARRQPPAGVGVAATGARLAKPAKGRACVNFAAHGRLFASTS